MVDVPASTLEKLRQYDTPTICNVIELFDVQPRTDGFMDGRIRACFPKMAPMVGFASTATFRSAFPPASGSVYASMSEQVASFGDLPGPAVVVFQDLDSPPKSATFGEVMCTTYKAFGAAGLITSGAARDLEQVEALEFPCFSDGTICSHGYCHILEVNGPVHVGGICVQPRDLIHGDCNGVTKIPIEIANAVADACKDFVDAETIVLSYLQAGNVTVEGFTEAREACKAKMDEIAKQVTAKRK